MNRQISYPSTFAALALVSAASVMPVSGEEQKPYEDFASAKFSNPTKIANPWFPLEPGTRQVWEGTTVDEEGVVEPHRVVFVVTDLTKVIGGVETRVNWDRDYKDGELEEAEIVFFAQANDGTIWHLGQYPEEYEDGKINATPGWLHGINGHAGIMMPADPKLGDPEFSQGWAPNVPWTDRAMVHKTGVKVETGYGTFEDVIVFAEHDREEPNARQYKYYARGVGNIKIGFSGDDTTQEQMELISVEKLSEEELAEVRKEARRIEANAVKFLPEIFGKVEPAQQR
ncbi:hypothetical protein [Candidatus Thiosymbion oneisti]|uniref:hypothetical protein n=1 Tax=Candidatus Thiosymbion oneisti TaxID=589554 RepID=UPI000A50390D|nr:hypothetical protein [Candidatus Thiosymbion oneisti]